MYTYLLNRLGMTILVLLIVITFLSLLIQFIPGTRCAHCWGRAPRQIYRPNPQRNGA